MEIPRNIKAIDEARAYGDLSENFEYQSAKDNERILNRRREDLEEELRSVTGTDFSDFAPAVAGIGARVVLRQPDGTMRVCNILGEWDHDEELCIYSNRSGLALSLEGKKPGDSVTVPSEDGPMAVTVESVGPFDDAVRAWIRAIPEPEAAAPEAAPAPEATPAPSPEAAAPSSEAAAPAPEAAPAPAPEAAAPAPEPPASL